MNKNKSNKVLCIDPGPSSSGYVLLDVNSWKIIDSGTADWDTLCDYVKNYDLVGVAVEKIIMYHGITNNTYVIPTAFECGRIYQICQEKKIDYREKERIGIIESIVGHSCRGKGNTTSKAQMQQEVQKILKLNSPVRPQHANDALCAGLVLWEHPYVKKQIKKLEQSKKGKK